MGQFFGRDDAGGTRQPHRQDGRLFRMRSVIMRASVLVSLSLFACSEDVDDTADGAASATQSTEAGVTQSDSADADSNADSSGDDGVDTGAEDAGGDGDDGCIVG